MITALPVPRPAPRDRAVGEAGALTRRPTAGRLGTATTMTTPPLASGLSCAPPLSSGWHLYIARLRGSLEGRP